MIARALALAFLLAALAFTPAQAFYNDVFPLCKSAVAVSAPVDVNEDILAICPIPAGAMGLNGILRIKSLWSVTNNANAKTVRVRFSGIGGTVLHVTSLANFIIGSFDGTIPNRGAANSQISTFVGFFGSAVLTPPSVTTTVDTTAITSLVITCQKAVGTDACTLEAFYVELLGGGT